MKRCLDAKKKARKGSKRLRAECANAMCAGRQGKIKPSGDDVQMHPQGTGTRVEVRLRVCPNVNWAPMCVDNIGTHAHR